MDKLQNRLSDKNLRELKQMTLLIDEYCKPQLITLFGKYAGTSVQSAMGGYEFLVIVDRIKLSTEREELQDFVHLRYPPSERFEQEFFIHLFARDFFLSNIFRSHFFKCILTEGVELHSTNTLPLEKFNQRKAVKKKYLDKANAHAERCLNTAELFLQDADAKTITFDCGICGFYLYHALEQLLMALEYRHYGFRREYDHISRHFQVAKHASRELCEFYESRKNEILKIFKGLKKFRDDSLYCETYGYPDDTVYRYLDIIGKMQKIIAN